MINMMEKEHYMKEIILKEFFLQKINIKKIFIQIIIIKEIIQNYSTLNLLSSFFTSRKEFFASGE